MRDLVLVGGGHAHVEVLRSFAMRPPRDVRLSVIAREVMTPYSGMLPGHLAGIYGFDVCHVDLGPLARAANARLYHTRALALDLAGGRVECAGRPHVPFDLVSLDVGATPDDTRIEGAAGRVLAVKPVNRFLAQISQIEAKLGGRADPLRLVVIGGGAGGIEVALALDRRLATLPGGRRREGLSVTVVTDTAVAMPSHGRPVRARLARVLAQRGIRVLTGARAAAIADNVVRLAPDGEVPFDAVVLATDARAPDWLADSGLALDARGFVRVSAALRSVSDERVFAAGDVAAIEGRALAKSGVYAVRQGPVLAENLRRAQTGRRLVAYRPQPRTLALISTADKRAIASWGTIAFEGAWVWRLKDWIDRRWMRKYQDFPAMEDATRNGTGHGEDAMRCGGCGAKVPQQVLRSALARFAADGDGDDEGGNVLVGLREADDAAVFAPPPGQVVVQSVDHFRPFIDDPYLFARVAANHCLGDLYAMGAAPATALAHVTLPFGPENKVADDLYLVLAGVRATLADQGARLIGGHTGEGAELALGLTVNGFCAPESLLAKGGMKPGDALILTKPLGTGVLFAAHMRGLARSAWIEAALQTMLASSGPALEALRAHGVRALTDVTGFGLAGHLAEMLRPSGAGAEIALDALPAIDGALEVLGRGTRSTLHPANQAAMASVIEPAAAAHPAASLLFDPQTAGGLLASLPAERADTCIAALRDAGIPGAARIGTVTDRVERVRLV